MKWNKNKLKILTVHTHKTTTVAIRQPLPLLLLHDPCVQLQAMAWLEFHCDDDDDDQDDDDRREL